MGIELKELIAKLKQEQEKKKPQENSQNIKPKIEPIIEKEEEIEDYEEEEVEIPAGNTPKEAPLKQEIDPNEQMLMEIEMLQNNGRFRGELLHQLQEMNKALIIIAGVLVDLTGGDKK